MHINDNISTDVKRKAKVKRPLKGKKSIHSLKKKGGDDPRPLVNQRQPIRLFFVSQAIAVGVDIVRVLTVSREDCIPAQSGPGKSSEL